MKSKGLQINLRKKNESDNWYSLFKSKAIGEKDTDEEDALADAEAKKWTQNDRKTPKLFLRVSYKSKFN